MIERYTRWRVAQDDIGRLSETLRPIRSQEEVAELLGCSPALVGQLERSALRKIMRALVKLEPERLRSPNINRHNRLEMRHEIHLARRGKGDLIKRKVLAQYKLL